MKIQRVIGSIFWAAIFIFLSIACQADTKSYSPLEQSNLNKAIYCMEILENRNDLQPKKRIDILRSDCYAESFIEHSPHISNGREGLFKLFLGRYAEFPKLSMSIKRSASEGDLVWLHIHAKRTPESRGAALIHIFRLKDGMIVEHWGVGQPVPEQPKNKNTMF